MKIMVDIDETICYHENNNNNGSRDYSNANPYTNRIKKINTLYDEGNTIIYWTARGTMTGINWFNTTLEQLNRWGCKFHEVRMVKQAYALLIDDKNTISGTFFYAN